METLDSDVPDAWLGLNFIPTIKAQEITSFPSLIILLATRPEFVSGQFVLEAILSQVVIADNIAAYYCGLQKYCENQIKRATHTQHRLLVSSPYKSYACHAYTYYFYFQNSEVLYLYYIIHPGQFLSVVGAMVARRSLRKRAAS